MTLKFGVILSNNWLSYGNGLQLINAHSESKALAFNESVARSDANEASTHNTVSLYECISSGNANRVACLRKQMLRCDGETSSFNALQHNLAHYIAIPNVFENTVMNFVPYKHTRHLFASHVVARDDRFELADKIVSAYLKRDGIINYALISKPWSAILAIWNTNADLYSLDCSIRSINASTVLYVATTVSTASHFIRDWYTSTTKSYLRSKYVHSTRINYMHALDKNMSIALSNRISSAFKKSLILHIRDVNLPGDGSTLFAWCEVRCCEEVQDM